ncbi:DUF58 domain-containing protein [Salana multivorans]
MRARRERRPGEDTGGVGAPLTRAELAYRLRDKAERAAPPRWFVTHASMVLVVVALALVVLGVALGRPVAVAVAAVVLVPALTGSTGTTGRDRPTVRLGRRAAPEDEPDRGPAPGDHPATLTVTGGLARIRASYPGYRSAFALAGPGEVEIVFTSARTGELPPLRVDSVLVSDDGVREAGAGSLDAPTIVVEPVVRDLRDLPVPEQLIGLTGTHRSRRRGDGDDLHDLAPFAPGDRIRSVDWRTTARRGTTDPRVGTRLWVRRRVADAEAAVVVVLDSRDDVGADVSRWAGDVPPVPGESTSLDRARQAAASYARSYLRAGDRVGFTDLAVRQRSVRPGAGGRHLARIARSIVLSSPRGEPTALVRAPQITAGALVVVVSTFLDDDAATAARVWHGEGHPVIAVDVLGEPQLGALDVTERVAARVVLAGQRARLEALRAAGVRVVEWPA